MGTRCPKLQMLAMYELECRRCEEPQFERQTMVVHLAKILECPELRLRLQCQPPEIWRRP